MTAGRLDFFLKINKRTCPFIREVRVRLYNLFCFILIRGSILIASFPVVRISALCSEGRYPDNFSFVFWEKR